MTRGGPGFEVTLIGVALLAVATSGPLIAAAAVPALAIAFWRNALGALAIAPFAVARRSELRALGRRELLYVGAAGAFLALHFATWVPSLDRTSVASATALVATQPVWAALIARARGELVPARTWAGIGIALAGVALLCGIDVSLSGDALLGDVMAVAGGIFAAAYMTAGSEVRRSVSTTTYTSLCYATTALLLLPACLLSRSALSGYQAGDWLKLLALTAGAQLLGHSLFNRALKTFSPTVISLCILLEIPGAALLAALFLGQSVPLLAIPAAALLVAGIWLVVRTPSGAEPSAPVE